MNGAEGKYEAFENGMSHSNRKHQNPKQQKQKSLASPIAKRRNEFYNQMHWKCQLVYTIIMFCKHPAAWLAIKKYIRKPHLFLRSIPFDFHYMVVCLNSNGQFQAAAITPNGNYSTAKYLHSSQLSLPFRMQRFFLFLIQFSLHVKQNPLLVHVSHPVGHGIHSWRFLSP